MELCGNIQKYDEIVSWIQSKTQDYVSKICFDDVLFVTGNSGIGKTYSIKKICQDLTLFVTYISSNICYNSNELIDHIIKASSSSLLQTLTNNHNPKIIIIDDFDSIITIDRTVNSSLINLLTTMRIKRIPIICISSCEVIKRVGSIKNKCKIIELFDPESDDVQKTLKQKFPKCKNIKKIVKNNKNLSQCIKQIEYSETDFFDNMDDLINVNILYGNDFQRNRITKTILTDPWIIPLRFHENIIIELKNRKITISKCNILYKHFLINFIIYDMMMYKTNSSNLVVDYFTSIIYDFLNLENKKDKRCNIANFTKILSFISLQKKNIKRNYTKSFPLYQINNYHINNTRNFISFN